MNEQEILTTENSSTMFCPNCGKTIQRHSVFCPECGQKNTVSSNAIATATETATPPVTPTNNVVTQAPLDVPAMVSCPKCGASLPTGTAFCGHCGSPVHASAPAQKKKRITKKKLIIIIAAAALAVVIFFSALLVGILAFSNSSSPSGISNISTSTESKLRNAYNTHCSSTWATIGSDGSYLEIDTNPNNKDDYVNTEAYRAIEKVNDALGLPSYLFSEMGKTTALMGRQSETFDSLDLSVSWSYHPDNGLVVTYKVTK